MSPRPMVIDCETCPARGRRCDGCMMSALVDGQPIGMPLDALERRAVGVFVSAGLVSASEARRLRAGAEAWRPRREVG